MGHCFWDGDPDIPGEENGDEVVDAIYYFRDFLEGHCDYVSKSMQVQNGLLLEIRDLLKRKEERDLASSGGEEEEEDEEPVVRGKIRRERDAPTEDSADEGLDKVLEELEKGLEDGEMTLDNSAES
jgi:hypothetical protein